MSQNAITEPIQEAAQEEKLLSDMEAQLGISYTFEELASCRTQLERLEMRRRKCLAMGKTKAPMMSQFVELFEKQQRTKNKDDMNQLVEKVNDLTLENLIKYAKQSKRAATLLEAKEYWKMGELFALQEQWSQSVDYLNKAYIIDEKVAEVHAQNLPYLDKALQEVIDGFRQKTAKGETPSTEEEDRYVGALFTQVCLHLGRRDFQANANQLDECIKLRPQHKRAYELKGVLYCFKRMFDEALKIFEKVVECDPQYPMGYYYMASCKNNLVGRVSDAIEDYEKYLTLVDPDHEKVGDCHYKLATLYFAMAKNSEKGRYHYEKGLEYEKTQLPCMPPPHAEPKQLATIMNSAAAAQSGPSNANVNNKNTNKCLACGKGNVELKQCARCGNASYCSKECQTGDWKTHKLTCVKKN